MSISLGLIVMAELHRRVIQEIMNQKRRMSRGLSFFIGLGNMKGYIDNLDSYFKQNPGEFKQHFTHFQRDVHEEISLC